MQGTKAALLIHNSRSWEDRHKRTIKHIGGRFYKFKTDFI